MVFSFLLLTLNIQLTAVEPVETAFSTSSLTVSEKNTEHILISEDNSFTNLLWEETVVAAGLKKTTKNSFKNLIQSLINYPSLSFCLVFTIVFGIGVGITSGNFGSLVRYRIPFLPFFSIK